MDGRAYYFPVQPPEVAAYSGYHHDYPATDIFAPTGSTFVAVTDGVIDELRTDDPWDPAVRRRSQPGRAVRQPDRRRRGALLLLAPGFGGRGPAGG